MATSLILQPLISPWDNRSVNAPFPGSTSLSFRNSTGSRWPLGLGNASSVASRITMKLLGNSKGESSRTLNIYPRAEAEESDQGYDVEDLLEICFQDKEAFLSNGRQSLSELGFQVNSALEVTAYYRISGECLESSEVDGDGYMLHRMSYKPQPLQSPNTGGGPADAKRGFASSSSGSHLNTRASALQIAAPIAHRPPSLPSAFQDASRITRTELPRDQPSVRVREEASSVLGQIARKFLENAAGERTQSISEEEPAKIEHIMGHNAKGSTGKIKQARCRWCFVKYNTISWTTYKCLTCGIYICVGCNRNDRDCWNAHIRASQNELEDAIRDPPRGRKRSRPEIKSNGNIQPDA